MFVIAGRFLANPDVEGRVKISRYFPNRIPWCSLYGVEIGSQLSAMFSNNRSKTFPPKSAFANVRVLFLITNRINRWLNYDMYSVYVLNSELIARIRDSSENDIFKCAIVVAQNTPCRNYYPCRCYRIAMWRLRRILPLIASWTSVSVDSMVIDSGKPIRCSCEYRTPVPSDIKIKKNMY